MGIWSEFGVVYDEKIQIVYSGKFQTCRFQTETITMQTQHLTKHTKEAVRNSSKDKNRNWRFIGNRIQPLKQNRTGSFLWGFLIFKSIFTGWFIFCFGKFCSLIYVWVHAIYFIFFHYHYRRKCFQHLNKEVVSFSQNILKEKIL